MALRMLHIFAAIGIALIANSIQPDWLGFVVLIVLLGAYAYLVAVRGPGKNKRD